MSNWGNTRASRRGGASGGGGGAANDNDSNGTMPGGRDVIGPYQDDGARTAPNPNSPSLIAQQMMAAAEIIRNKGRTSTSLVPTSRSGAARGDITQTALNDPEAAERQRERLATRASLIAKGAY